MENEVEEITLKTKKRRPCLAFFLSLIAPGLGQFYNGQLVKCIICIPYTIPIFLLSIPLLLIGFKGFVLIVILEITVRLFISFDAAFVAKKKTQYSLKRCNKWFVYLILVFLIPYTEFNISYLTAKHITLHFIQPCKIITESMYPTVHKGDKVIVDKTYDPSAHLKRGRVVLVEGMEKFPESYIKRVIGLPGETIQIIDKVLYINNKPTKEPWELSYSSDPNFTGYSSNFAKYAVRSPCEIPKDKVFLLGDNRDHSLDSRQWGPVDFNDIKGKALYIHWSDDVGRIGKNLE